MILQNVKIYTTAEILAEYQTVLKRDFDFSDEEITEIMEKVLAFVTIVKPLKKLKVVVDDPDDNIILECAIESKYVITYDPHLLDVKEHEGIQIIRPEIARAIF